MTTFFYSAWLILVELAPWLLLGAVVAGALHVLLPRDFLNRQLRGNTGLLKSVVLGVPLPLCSCAVIPVGLSLKQSGASNGATVAFLVSTPQTGVDSILVSASFLGWPFALFKVISAAVTGLVGGWWTNLNAAGPTLPIVAAEHSHSHGQHSAIGAFFAHSLELIRSIWRWLVVGVFVSAAITTWIPSDAMASLAGYGGLAAMLVTLVISLPFYVCATASVPIAAALVSSGLPAGAALVFLMAGPATNVATIGAVYRALGRRALAIYLTTVIVGSIASGLLFGYLLDTANGAATHHHETHSWPSTASAAVLVLLFAWFLLEEIKARLPSKSPAPVARERS